MYPSHLFRGVERSRNGVVVVGNQMEFNMGDSVLDLTRSPMLSPRSSSNLTALTSTSQLHAQFGGLAHGNLSVLEMGCSSIAEDDRFQFQRDSQQQQQQQQELDPWHQGDFNTEDATNHNLGGVEAGVSASLDCSVVSKDKRGDYKVLRRLAQNREAAKKSRLRKKAYVQQLESSRLKLAQLEQELHRARQQGIFLASGCSSDHGHSIGGNGPLAFDMEYARWLDEHQRQVNDLRSALNSHMGDDDLRLLVDAIMSHYDEVFRLKSIGTKTDVFHMLSGMWTTPAERCFMWLGGFRASELLKILAGHLEPLSDQQLMGICNLQQSSQQAEDALSQGMEALQQSLADTLAAANQGPSAGSDNVANYMNQMATAMGKLATLENFLRQADLLRQQTLQQMHRILTTHQTARALLAISNYFSRLRALSSLWLARPRG